MGFNFIAVAYLILLSPKKWWTLLFFFISYWPSGTSFLCIKEASAFSGIDFKFNLRL